MNEYMFNVLIFIYSSGFIDKYVASNTQYIDFALI